MSDNNTEQKKKLVILTGPTAVGKTDLSIGLAKAIGGEIISADSIQVYRHLNIGSAKISEEEMQGVPHHLIDVLEPNESFHVADFKRMAAEAMVGIYDRGHIPIITGGTGFYIQSVLRDIQFTETVDDGYRDMLAKLQAQKGAEFLHGMLKETDPAAAEAIPSGNVRRVIRALEFFHQTGQRISEHNAAERERKSPYNFAYFVLCCNRALLYERIERRIDVMLGRGLVDEVRGLVRNYGLDRDAVSMQGLGYKEILQYLNGELSYEEAVYILKRDTRHFAKRQLTWFRREQDVIWVDKEKLASEEEQLAYILDILRNKSIL